MNRKAFHLQRNIRYVQILMENCNINKRIFRYWGASRRQA